MSTGIQEPSTNTKVRQTEAAASEGLHKALYYGRRIFINDPRLAAITQLGAVTEYLAIQPKMLERDILLPLQQLRRALLDLQHDRRPAILQPLAQAQGRNKSPTEVTDARGMLAAAAYVRHKYGNVGVGQGRQDVVKQVNELIKGRKKELEGDNRDKMKIKLITKKQIENWQNNIRNSKISWGKEAEAYKFVVETVERMPDPSAAWLVVVTRAVNRLATVEI